MVPSVSSVEAGEQAVIKKLKNCLKRVPIIKLNF